ncbi:MAG: IS1595 family transposase [Bryobacteraceae bacterium]
METPKTLIEAVTFFNEPKNAIKYLASRRWPTGVTCPYCETENPMFLETRLIWKCRRCHKQFSVKVGTIFEDSAIALGKWLVVTWQLVNCKNGVSSYEIAKAIGVTQKTAWFMLQRIRKAMQDDRRGGKLSGEVEVDESYIGGKARNMHKSHKLKTLEGKGGGSVGKTAVQGMLQRGGEVRLRVIENTQYHNVVPAVHDNVEAGSHLFTDEVVAYFGLRAEYAHQVINHAETYVNGQIHTNGMENFWSLLKRGLHGTYISVEPFHLFRYLDEQALRFNLRKLTDSERFAFVCSHVTGRRLTWNEMTAKTTPTEIERW